MKKILIILILACTALSAAAQQKKHLVRLGWGDSTFETLVFYPSAGKSAFSYSGHIFADYHYSFTPVVSVGGQLDWQAICWNQEDNSRLRNFDFCIIPDVRFTYFRREWVRLYSGVGIGLLCAWDNAGGREAAPVFNLNPIGVQVGKGHWCGALDLGFMAALKGVNHIYMFGSRLISVSVNYRW